MNKWAVSNTATVRAIQSQESTPYNMLYIIRMTSDQVNIFNAKQYNPIRAVLSFLYKFEAVSKRLLEKLYLDRCKVSLLWNVGQYLGKYALVVALEI